MATNDDLFLPNFCGMRMVLALLVIAQLLAFVLALGPYGSADRWSDLSLFSLFILWTALVSAALLCASRPLLRRLDNATAAALSYVLLLAVTALVSEGVYWLLRGPAFGLELAGDWHRDFLLRNVGISAVVSALALRYFYVQHQWKKNLESEASARIEALQARIRPHFLFNSMNTIASLTRSQPHIAEAAVQNLADLFRASLAEVRNQTSLRDELELCRKYLAIEKLRLGERLDVQWDTDDLPHDALLPALTLQPLLENAVYHGIEPLPQGGTIHISGRREQNLIHISIANPISPNSTSKRPPGNHMALDNVRQRLAAYYGAQGRLHSENGGAHGRHSVLITFPYRVSEHEHTHR
ncbi:MAG: sensor histidine kinase [Pseudomonadota bacterium]